MPIISPIDPIDPIDSATSIDPSIIIIFDLLSTGVNDLIDPTTVTITINNDMIWENESVTDGWEISIVPIGDSFRYYITNFTGFTFNEDISVTVSINAEE